MDPLFLVPIMTTKMGFDLTFFFSKNVSLSLAERQQLQRAQQLKFLKDQGLIKDEMEVRGGAGVSPRNVPGSDANSSVTSVSYATTSVSYPGAKPKRKSTS